MSDLIKRGDAIEAVGKESYVADIDGAPTRVYRDVDVMWELYHLPSAQQWIPCSERLPEDDRTVLVTLKWDSDDYEVTVGKYWHDSPTVHGWGNFERYVIAWMPLPEPFREDGGTDE